MIDDVGIATSLTAKLQAAQNLTNPARNDILDAFISEVNAETDKHIDGVASQVLIEAANSLKSQ